MTAANGHFGTPNEPADKPLIGITMGEPAGIGAEVIVKALDDPEVRGLGRFIIYGLNELISYAADLAEVSAFWYREPHDSIRRVASGVVVADFDEYAMLRPDLRRPTAEGGHASMRFLDEAISDLQQNRLDALVTGPIDKFSWKMAGLRFPGHTEKLAHAFKARRVAMMFDGGGLRVALGSIHVPLFELRDQFTIGMVFNPIDLLNEALRDWFGIERPRIAVCGINPHAGEGGLFGDEERRVIEPAMVMAREADIDVEGPFPADSLFWRAKTTRRWDGIVAMYHDQGLIPVKLLAFDSAVNVTLGLPVIRTSVDHGVGYDIAGRNAANPNSMKAAIRLAARLARTRATTVHPVSPPQHVTEPE